MPNPFLARFDSDCADCGGTMFENDDEVFACEGEYVCRDCAEKRGNVCECGQYKKSEFETCFECR